MRVWLLLLLLLQGAVAASIWEVLLRFLFPEQKSLEDAPNCGVLGEVRAGGVGRTGRKNKTVVDECLWDCEWKPNPLFKYAYRYDTKLNEKFYNVHSTLRLLLTSPKLPTDLNCLRDCFSGEAKLKDFMIECSANGLDRQVPTHTKEGKMYKDQNYSNMNLFWDSYFNKSLENGKFDRDLRPVLASLNPNLDCFIFARRGKSQISKEISNFIDDVEFQDTDDDDDDDDGDDDDNDATRAHGDEKQLAGNAFEEAIKGFKFRKKWKKEQTRLFENKDFETFKFRASTPVKTAIEVCALAKLIALERGFKDYLAIHAPNTKPIDVPDLFTASTPTCDDFMPDVFKPLCSCVGTCQGTLDTITLKPNNEVDGRKQSFYTGGGIAECQAICQNTTACNFFTLSSVQQPIYVADKGWTALPEINTCNLWTNCDRFTIPAKSTGYQDLDALSDQRVISDHWSGPRDCKKYDYTATCKILDDPTNSKEEFWNTQISPIWKETKRRRQVRKKNRKRVFGASTTVVTPTNRFPWLCSLKETGFTGRHRCGVTLLSGNDSDEAILVSSAHCNYLCKDRNGNKLEICCCRQPHLKESCQRTSSFCGTGASLVAAKPSELNIVCSEYSLEVRPEGSSKEEEVVLYLDRITNHPDYSPGTVEDVGANTKGPYAGADLAVYHLTVRSNMALRDRMKSEKGGLSPACLPKKTYPTTRGIFAGWLDQEPYYRVSTDKISAYERNYLTLKTTQVEKMTCRDPEWMKSKTSSFYHQNTFYPAGTECYRDPSQASCFLFGNSGSGIVRQFATVDGTDRYAFTGPLSMSKSCDQAYIVDNQVTYNAENPGIFTDAYCYLPWIASMYGLKPPAGYTAKDSCKKSIGVRQNIGQAVCMGEDVENLDRGRCPGCKSDAECSFNDNNNELISYDNLTDCLKKKIPREGMGKGRRFEQCDFTYKEKTDEWNECRLVAKEGYAYNIYICKDKEGNNMTCANNCRGVDPNSVIIGGGAVLALATVSFTSFVVPALALGAPVAVVGAGGFVATMLGNRCPTGQCRARDARRPRQRKCCRVRAGGRCPRRC